MDECNSSQQEETVLKIIQDINSGTCDPNLLDKATRQQCIEVLIAEGYTFSQLAQLLKRSEKTISRDMQEIRKNNALTPNIDFAKETVGELVTKARMHSSYLMRLARDRDSPAASKAEAEFFAWRVFKELVEKLQTLGFLPLKPQEFSGDIYHHVLNKEDDSYEVIKKMICEVESVAKETGTFSPELADEISQLSARLDKAEIVLKVKNLSQKKQNGQTNQEVKDEK
jgi:hypothetical protein